jgi:poly(A) polymerase
LKKIFGFRASAPRLEATIIPRDQHSISRRNISQNALKVMYRLNNAGYSAYLVGGSVRDLLLGRIPKDFDVATNARPEQVKRLFRNSLLIGKRFRLVHVRFGHEIIEVATFRAMTTKLNKHRQQAQHGMLLRDNVYGTLEEDAERRDFTINALYYNIEDLSLVDYCGGVADLEQKMLRIIGEPRQRYHEDPVRLLRVIRFAGKLGLNIEPATEEPIAELAPLLQHVPAARLFDEILKIFHSGHASEILPLLRRHKLFEQLFPQVAACLNSEHAPQVEQLLTLVYKNTDARINENKAISAGFLFAALLWYPLQQLTQQLLTQEQPSGLARNSATHEVIARQIEQITIPRRFSIMIREIWDLQYRFTKMHPKRVIRLAAHPRFRAGYDFLLLRAQVEEDVKPLADWWQQFYEADTTQRQQLLEKSNLPKTKKRRRRSKRARELSSH